MSAIAKNDEKYTGVSGAGVEAEELDTTQGANGVIPNFSYNGKNSELGLLNAIMETDTYVVQYMSNDSQWYPLKTTVSGNSVTGLSRLTTRTLKIDSGSLGTLKTFYVDGLVGITASRLPNTETISINQAMWVPTDIPLTKGKMMGASGTLTNDNKYRLQLLLGALIANHYYLNRSPTGLYADILSDNEITSSYTGYSNNGLIAYLFGYQPPSAGTATKPSGYPGNTFPTTGCTFNVAHAVFLYVLARDSWLGLAIKSAGTDGFGI